MSNDKLYGVNVSVSKAEGYQTFGVLASSEKDALDKFRLGETTGEILCSEVDVVGLDKDSVTLDDVEDYSCTDEVGVESLENQLVEALSNFNDYCSTDVDYLGSPFQKKVETLLAKVRGDVNERS